MLPPRARGPPSLFDFEEPPAPDGKGQVALGLRLHDEREKAWLLSQTGKTSDAKWVPKSIAVRGEGRDRNVWTLPSWKARELGWA